MKGDLYLKIILTIMAACLIWICIKDIPIGEGNLFARRNHSGEQEVYVTGGELDVRISRVSATALVLAEPIQVEVVNY